MLEGFLKTAVMLPVLSIPPCILSFHSTLGIGLKSLQGQGLWVIAFALRVGILNYDVL